MQGENELKQQINEAIFRWRDIAQKEDRKELIRFLRNHLKTVVLEDKIRSKK